MINTNSFSLKNNLLLVLFFLGIVSVCAQEANLSTGELSGTLLEDKTDLPLPYASVVLKDGEGNITEGVITDEEGKFRIAEIKQGSFSLEIQYTGFQTFSTNIQIEGDKQAVDLGTIRLKEDATQLNEVVVTGETSQVSLRLDKKVFNVGNQSGSVTDVLGNVPSVSVSPSG